MSYETKQLAEKLMQLHNSTEILNDIISVLQSSENTVKEDITKLVDGAKLEPQFDLDELVSLVTDLDDETYNAEDYVSSAAGNIDDAVSSIDEVSRLSSKLKKILKDTKYKLKQGDQDSDDSDEGSDE